MEQNMSNNYNTKNENFIFKLNEIWNKRPEPKSENGARNRQFQFMLLTHILGNYMEGLNINIFYSDNNITVENEEAINNLRNAISFLISQINNKQEKNYNIEDNTTMQKNNDIDRIKQIALKYKKLYQEETIKNQELNNKIIILNNHINNIKDNIDNIDNIDTIDNDTIFTEIKERNNKLKQTITELHNKNIIDTNTIKELEGLNQIYIKDIKEKENEITNLKNNITSLNTKIKNFENTKVIAIDNQLTQEIFTLNNKINILETNNKELEENLNKIKKQNKELTTFILYLKDMENKILPFLQNTFYMRKYKGKSINLQPSEIQTIYRLHLKEYTNYKIWKDTGIAKTTIKKVLTLDYSTVDSLKKLLNALNKLSKEGRWNNKNKLWINTNIAKLNKKITIQTKKDNIQKEEIMNNIKTIKDFLNNTQK